MNERTLPSHFFIEPKETIDAQGNVKITHKAVGKSFITPLSI